MDKTLPKIRISTFLECLCALHLTAYVESPFQHRGGLIIVGPPGQLKTTMMEIALNRYEDHLALSDINSTNLNALRSRLSSGSINTLMVPDMQKLYERDPRSSANLEGNLRGLVSEGFMGATMSGAMEVHRFKARACVITATTEDFTDRYHTHWEQSGFLRRFMWALIRLGNQEMLMKAVEDWELADLGSINAPAVPANGSIPHSTTKEERQQLRPLIREQYPPREIQFQLICKMADVLKWHYQRINSNRNHMEVITEFAGCLTKGGAQIIIGDRMGLMEAANLKLAARQFDGEAASADFPNGFGSVVPSREYKRRASAVVKSKVKDMKVKKGA